MSRPDASNEERKLPDGKPYEAPRVEKVLTPKELEREVSYGGFASVDC